MRLMFAGARAVCWHRERNLQPGAFVSLPIPLDLCFLLTHLTWNRAESIMTRTESGFAGNRQPIVTKSGCFTGTKFGYLTWQRIETVLVGKLRLINITQSSFLAWNRTELTLDLCLISSKTLWTQMVFCARSVLAIFVTVAQQSFRTQQLLGAHVGDVVDFLPLFRFSFPERRLERKIM